RDATDAVPAPVEVLGHRAVGRVHGGAKVVEPRGEVVEDRADLAGVAADDVDPETAVAAGDPDDVAQALTGEGQIGAGRLGEQPGGQRRDEVRHVRDEGDGAVVGLGVHP